MPQSITIPRSIRGAERKLAELGGLAHATEWHRAAIVAAYVDPDLGRGGPPNRRANRSSDVCSAEDFAEHGIAGLRSAATVRIYARAWLNSFDRPAPGQRLQLPDPDTHPWPPTRPDSAGSRVSADPERAVEQVIERHGPEVVAQVVTQRAPAATRSALVRHDTEAVERSGLGAAGRGVQRVADQADANYRSTEYGTDDPDAQWVIEAARRLAERRLQRTEDPSAELISALSVLESVANAWRTGSAPTWSAGDRAFADELGIDLTGMVTP